MVSTRVEVCAATASGRGQWQGQAKSAQENGSEEWRLQRELRQGGTGGENARCVRPSLRVQQGGGGSGGFPKEGPVAKVVIGLGRRALPTASEVKGRVFFELGRHLGMQQLRPGRGLEADGREGGAGVTR